MSSPPASEGYPRGTGIDIQSWVIEPSGAPPPGIVGSLFEAILDAGIEVAKLAPEAEQSRRLHGELERFVLWGYGASISNGQLDDMLSKSRELRQAVLSAIYGLGRVFINDLLLAYQAVDTRSSSSYASPTIQTLQEQLEMISSTSEDVRRLSWENLSDDENTRDTISEVIDIIEFYINCLMDLSSMVDTIDVDDDEEDLETRLETFNVDTELARLYCRRIRDQFPELPKFLVERLGKANDLRTSQLKSLQLRVPTQSTDEGERAGKAGKEEGSTQPSENLLSNVQREMTVTNGTDASQMPESVFDKANPIPYHPIPIPKTDPDRIIVPHDDAQSFVSSSSFASSSSVTGRRYLRRVPPLPEARPVQCPACHNILHSVDTEIDWKKHIFGDLQPYICTIGSCHLGQTLFRSREEWIRHEISHPESRTTEFSCAFCSKQRTKSFKDSQSYYKHLGRHLCQVSLAVLPQDQDDDSEAESGQSVPANDADDLSSDIGESIGELLGIRLFLSQGLKRPFLPQSGLQEISTEKRVSRTIAEVFTDAEREIPPDRLQSLPHNIYGASLPPDPATDLAASTTRAMIDNYTNRTLSASALNVKNIGGFFCETCDRKFNSKNAANQHMDARDHWAPRFGCQTCDREFHSKHAASQHMDAKDHWAPTFPCEACDREFNSQNAASQHMDDKDHWSFPRETYNREFNSQIVVNQYIGTRDHWAVSTFGCKTCDREFDSQHAANQHMDAKDHWSFPCETCNRKFNSQHAANQHMDARDHWAAPTFGCETCDREFDSKHAANQHMDAKDHWAPIIGSSSPMSSLLPNNAGGSRNSSGMDFSGIQSKGRSPL